MGKTCGIYQITVNDNSYIGSSQNINRRFWEHLWKLKNKTHTNKHMENVYNKYGEGLFQLSVLEECDISNLIKLEQKWIDLLKPNLNKAPVAGTTRGLKLTKEQCVNRKNINTGRKHSAESIKKRTDKIKGRKYTSEHKAKISASRVGKKASDESIKKRISKCKKPVACYDLNNVLIKVYESSKDASLQTNCQATNITRCCKNKLKTHKNMIWRYYEC
jgi:group I intron endonuclease